MRRRLGNMENDEAGTALILALVFVFAVSLVFVAIVSLAGTSLLNTTNLRSQRSLEFAADGATSAAVQWVRNACPYDSSGGANCSGMYTGSTNQCLPNNTTSTTINGVAVSVVCESLSAAPPAGQPPLPSRTIQFFTCRSSVALNACNSTGSNASNLLLQAQVTFEDLDPNNNNTCVPSPPPGTSSSCGIGMTISYWDVSTADN